MAGEKTAIYESKQKELFNRQRTTENRGHVYRNTLCFPSILALDTHAGFDNGILTAEDTNIIAVERNKTRRNAVRNQLDKRTNKYQIAGTEAERVKLNKYLKDGEKIDYMPFDICGNFGARIAGWFYRNQKHFADGMRMSVTLTAINRRLETYNEIKQITGDTYIKTAAKAMKNAVFTGIGVFSMTPKMRNHIASQVFMLINSMPNKHIDINNATIYANTDVSALAKHMIVLDTYVYDAESDVKKTNLFHRIIRGYNQKVGYASQVRLKVKVKKVKAVRVRIPKVEKVELTIAEKQKALVNAIIESGVNNRGIAWVTTGQKATMTRWCNKLGKNPDKVWCAVRSWIRMRSGYKGVINTYLVNRSR